MLLCVTVPGWIVDARKDMAEARDFFAPGLFTPTSTVRTIEDINEVVVQMKAGG